MAKIGDLQHPCEQEGTAVAQNLRFLGGINLQLTRRSAGKASPSNQINRLTIGNDIIAVLVRFDTYLQRAAIESHAAHLDR